MGEELVSQLALCKIPYLGSALIHKLISYCGSASAVFDCAPGKLQSIPGVGIKVMHAIKHRPPLQEARKEMDLCRAKGISWWFYTHPQFPQRLRVLPNTPVLVYSKGHPVWNHPRSIAIVGTRSITPYGEEAIQTLLEQLKKFQPLIISGLAYGVDVSSHRNALLNQLPTIGVVAHGLDLLYPSVHKNTADKMLSTGALVSELPPGTKPDPFQFPRRNRIIAAMADALLVVEAQDKGGALITASLAQQFGRPVFAVPGRITSSKSNGCHQLIRKGEALLLQSADDIARHMGWEITQNHPAPARPHMDSEQHLIMELLSTQEDGLAIDEISWKVQLPINRVASLLINLEFEGLIKCLPGKKFLARSK